MRVLFLVLVSALISSCSLRPAEPSPYIKDAYKLEDHDIFQKVWRSEDFRKEKYTKIAVKPVSTKFLRRLGWWDKKHALAYDDSGVFPGMKRNDTNVDMADDFSKYFTDQINNAFKKSKLNQLQWVSHYAADSQTMVLHIEIIELVPLKKFFIGLGLLGDGSFKGGTMAIEGHVREGRTNKLLGMFTDRKIDRISDFSENTKVSWYSHCKPLIEEWCEEFVKLANLKNHRGDED